MIYKSYAAVARDVQDWCTRLPPIAGVCGIPRAGSLIAYLISAHMNCQLIEFSDLINRKETWKQPRRRNCPASEGKILVVDDTCATGGHMRTVKEQLKELPYDFLFGAYFVMTNGRNEVSQFYRDVGNEDHLFEFNIFHHWYTQNILTDLDGVISADWTHTYETGDKEAEYLNHLENATCLIKPTFPVKAIVTGRLEKHRARTEAWLAKNGIRYGSLIMYPADRPEDRHSPAMLKAEAYKKSDAMIFVESCPVQSRTIKDMTGRDTLDWSQQKLI